MFAKIMELHEVQSQPHLGDQEYWMKYEYCNAYLIEVTATYKIVVVTVWLEQQSWHCYYSNSEQSVLLQKQSIVTAATLSKHNYVGCPYMAVLWGV